MPNILGLNKLKDKVTRYTLEIISGYLRISILQCKYKFFDFDASITLYPLGNGSIKYGFMFQKPNPVYYFQYLRLLVRPIPGLKLFVGSSFL